MKDVYVFEYINENEFHKLERSLKKYNMLAYKKLYFDYYPSLKEGKLLGEIISTNKEKGTTRYANINIHGTSTITGKLLSLLRESSSKIISFGTNLVSSIGSFVISVFFVIFALYFCFLDGKYLVSLVGKAIPINPKQMTSLLTKFVDISKNLLAGYVLVALYQGFASFIIMSIFAV